MTHRERFDEDQNDHDTLRFDPVFKIIAGRMSDDQSELASQPTLSRFENAVSIADLWKLREVLVEQFIQSFETPPASLTLDMDAFDDETHGQQQLTFCHGYDGQYLSITLYCKQSEGLHRARIFRCRSAEKEAKRGVRTSASGRNAESAEKRLRKLLSSPDTRQHSPGKRAIPFMKSSP